MADQKHSTECRFEHFLDYSNLKGQNEELLRKAFYAGSNVDPPQEPISTACPVCDAPCPEA